ncbi:MAG: AI-2 transport protein TqsA [Mariniblastus sp.]|jgi:AI-2 transport protein TqsA
MQKTQTACLVILATLAVGSSLFYLKPVLLPFVIALFVVVGCRPVLGFFDTKLKLNRYVSFAVAFAIGTATLIGFGLVIWLSINDLTRNSGAYEARLNTIAQWVGDRMLAQDNKKPIPAVNELVSPGTEAQLGAVNDLEVAAEDAKKAIAEFFESGSAFLQSQLLRFAGSLSSLLSYGVLITIFVFFLLLGPEQRQQHTPEIIREIEAQVRRYLIMKTVISALTGLAVGLVLWLFGVPLAVLFGFLAFLLNFIPNFGPLIGTLMPVPFLILNSEMSPSSAIICFLLVAAIQFISGNVIETRIMGRSFDVSPVVLLLALMLFGLVWGVIGMFLATPIVSIAKIVFQQHESTKPLGELMAGRWVRSDAPTEA